MSRTIAPWPFFQSEAETGRPNLPDELGAEAGRELARLLSAPDEAMCHDCAARSGSTANQCGATVMDFLKCAMEGVPFYCHVNEDQPCGGYIEARRQFAHGEDE